MSNNIITDNIDNDDELKQCLVDNHKINISQDWIITSSPESSNIILDQLGYQCSARVISYRHRLFQINRIGCSYSTVYQLLDNGLMKATNIEYPYSAEHMPWLSLYITHKLVNDLEFYDCLSQKIITKHFITTFQDIEVLSKDVFAMNDYHDIYLFKISRLKNINNESSISIDKLTITMVKKINKIIKLTNDFFMVAYYANKLCLAEINAIDVKDRYIEDGNNDVMFDIVSLKDGLVKRRGLFHCYYLHGVFYGSAIHVVANRGQFRYQFNNHDLSFTRTGDDLISNELDYYFPMSERTLRRVAKHVQQSTGLIKDLVDIICQYLTWISF